MLSSAHEPPRRSYDVLQIIRVAEAGTADSPTLSNALIRSSASENGLHCEKCAVWCCCTECYSDSCASFEKCPLWLW